ncbi:probable disease resistance protein At5g66900 [Prosopis cineraria]|uniref:probable disease resistance protein At5g66900 n=1 Tax=Prosopis cineraria TaxID=364024 RepID=UPI00240ED3BC|nr:probable disease resistance protein At5g66900 [Prosopis cineraria]
MVDAALLLELGEIASRVVEKGLKYNSTRETLKSTTKDLAPVVQQIEQSMKEMDHPTEEVEKLKEMLAANHEVLGKIQIHWWNCCLAPCFQGKLDEEYQSLVRYSSVQVQIHMLRDVKKILSKLSPHDVDDQRRQAITAQDQTRDMTPTPTFKDDDDDDDLEIFPEFTVGMDGPFVNELKYKLLNGNEQVLNLYGLTGSGKTTLAKKLCRDPLVRGKFKNNIIFETSLDSQIQGNEAMNQLQNRLLEVGENPVLLVLDDVRSSSPVSKNVAEQFKVRMSSGSKILVTSRNPIDTPAILYPMNPLSADDAIALLRHFVEPSNIDFTDNKVREILLQLVKDCKRLPMAIEFIGRKLQEKGGVEDLQKLQIEWSRCHSILDPNKDLLAHLQNSMHLLVDDCVTECFKDLGLFPEDQKIPVAALIDMWIELYNLDELGIYAMTFIHKLTALNLASGIKVKSRIVGRIEDNCYNNHFLIQHDLLRKLAIRMSNEELYFENRKRLIIDMNGNRRPDWWPRQQKQYKVAARILSISTDRNITSAWCNFHAGDAVVLVLNLKTTEFTLPEFIQKMRSLKVIVLANYGFHPAELKNPELLGCLWSLKRIRLQRVSVPYFLRELKNVRKLSLHMCEVKDAFENSSMEVSEAIPNLVDLNIEDCKDLVRLPAGLCDIVAMKKLSISGCPKFKELPEEIGKLENLELLRVSYCTDFNKMPESITKLKKLRLLDISNCVSLRKLPDNIGELRNLRKLYMLRCPISELPDSVNDMENLENVTCCEYTYPFWKVIKSNCSGLHLNMPIDAVA